MVAEQIAKELGCSLSQIEKDIAHLREIGVNIEYCTVERTYYSTTRPKDLLETFAIMIQQ